MPAGRAAAAAGRRAVGRRAADGRSAHRRRAASPARPRSPRLIERQLAETAAPDAMLIAETGGLNAMIVDSTALPEQAVRDILASAFQSAGQRCSALRVLYVQKDVEPKVLEMLKGAMDALSVGDPWSIVDRCRAGDRRRGARAAISDYAAEMEAKGRLIAKLDAPAGGRFVAPQVFRVSRHRRDGARGFRAGAACRELRGRRARPRHRRDQRARATA